MSIIHVTQIAEKVKKMFQSHLVSLFYTSMF